MADIFTKAKRSEIMSKIKSKSTKSELFLKRLLKGTYLRFQPLIYGNPDFGNKKRKIAIFVDGCFWHKCKKCFIPPKSNKKYWLPKLENNAKRDKIVNFTFKKIGWKVIRLWEHNLKKNPQKCLLQIKNTIR